MTTEHLDASRLYALIGEPARQLPDAAFATLELMLAAQERTPLQLAIRHIGNRPMANAIGEATAFDDMERDALGTILEILHSAQQTRGEDDSDTLLDDRLLEGLLIAGRLIVGRA